MLIVGGSLSQIRKKSILLKIKPLKHTYISTNDEFLGFYRHKWPPTHELKYVTRITIKPI